MAKGKEVEESKINKAISLKEQYRKALNKINKKDLIKIFEDFFQNNPMVAAVKWSQYTPYFMDGDPCLFSVNEPAISLNDTPEEFINFQWEEWDEKDISLSTIAERVDSLYNEMTNLEDIFDIIFGDHVTITITRNLDTTIDECSHD